MSFFTPKVYTPPPPPPPEPPSQADQARVTALSEEAMRRESGRRVGRGKTVVAGVLGETATGKTPTLLG